MMVTIRSADTSGSDRRYNASTIDHIASAKPRPVAASSITSTGISGARRAARAAASTSVRNILAKAISLPRLVRLRRGPAS
jgi:hypothetical protein